MRVPYYRARRVVIEKRFTVPYEMFASDLNRNKAIKKLNERCHGFYHLGPVEVRCV